MAELITLLTLLIVTVSNIFGLFPIQSLVKSGRFYGAILVTGAVIASIMMHATETKHKLPGLFLAEYSNMFLNIDRVLAYLTGLYGMFLFFTNPNKNVWQIVAPVVGATSCFIGERTENLLLYTLCHVVWHALAYGSLCLVNH